MKIKNVWNHHLVIHFLSKKRKKLCFPFWRCFPMSSKISSGAKELPHPEWARWPLSDLQREPQRCWGLPRSPQLKGASQWMVQWLKVSNDHPPLYAMEVRPFGRGPTIPVRGQQRSPSGFLPSTVELQSFSTRSKPIPKGYPRWSEPRLGCPVGFVRIKGRWNKTHWSDHPLILTNQSRDIQVGE